MLARVGGEQRRHHCATVHLDHRLREVLEEADQPAAPARIHFDLHPEVHQHLVEQHQRGEIVGLRLGQQLRQERLGRRRLSFGVLAVGVDQPQPIRPGQLPSQHTPWIPELPQLPVRAWCLHTYFNVDLVEAQRRDPRPGGLESDVRLELANRRQVGQRAGVMYQMPERDQRVRLAAAVVDGQLAVRLVAAPGQAKSHVLYQFAQIESRVGEGKERSRLLVYRPVPLLHHHVVQVGGKHRQRQLAALQIVAQLHDLMPGTHERTVSSLWSVGRESIWSPTRSSASRSS